MQEKYACTKKHENLIQTNIIIKFEQKFIDMNMKIKDRHFLGLTMN